MSMALINGDFLSFEEAAKAMNLSYNSVKKYAKDGLIEKVKFGNGVFISKEECERYNKHRNPRGNPLLTKPKKNRRKTG